MEATTSGPDAETPRSAALTGVTGITTQAPAPAPAPAPQPSLPAEPAEPPPVMPPAPDPVTAELPAWLQRLLNSAQLERHSPAAAAWLYNNDVKENEFGD